MPRILVFNGTPQAAESRLVEAGSRTYDTLIREAFDRHLADRAKIDYFTLRVADGKRLPQGLGIVDFDGVGFRVHRLMPTDPINRRSRRKSTLSARSGKRACRHSAHAGASS